MDKCICRLCQGEALALPLPQSKRAMLSDGRCIKVPLAKISCLNCGLVAHAHALSETEIRGVYGEEYALASASPAADAARAHAYAVALSSLLSPGRRILEIGCGSGALMQELHDCWTQATLIGIDPAVPERDATSARLTFRRGFFEMFAPDEEKFDLIYSVNVIEHVVDPADFFVRAAALLTKTGRLVLFCPASRPANLELLFHDHLHTFSQEALIRLAGAAGLVSSVQLERVEGLGDFQFMVFEFADGIPTHADFISGANVALAQERSAYLHAWQTLDATLCTRIAAAPRVALFGGGQMAALLRAYAPALWSRVDMLVMDNASDAWMFDKPVCDYTEERETLRDATVVIATAPQSQAAVAHRLASDGFLAVRFDDLISC